MTHPIRHILLDIEGTTCPVSFVGEVLFPYAQAQLPTFLRRHGEQERLRRLRSELLMGWRQEQDHEAQALWRDALQRVPTGRSEEQLPAHELVPYLQWLNRCDRKVTAWKDLQGLIWEEGYRNGELVAPLYEEVEAMLRLWHGEGLNLSVYSSGSVAAQRLLYAHSRTGDLTPLFSHWFDTRIGGKQDPESYGRILAQIDCHGGEVLFVSDAVGELNAASAHGIHCCFSDRPGNPQRERGAFPAVSSLREIDIRSLHTPADPL